MVELNTNIPCNELGTNANLKFNILDKSTMEKEGFRLIDSNRVWSISYAVPVFTNLELSITYDTFKNLLGICVLDMDFCQPYDYQSFIYNALRVKKEPRKEHLEIKEFVENKILYLQSVGIISNYKKNDII